MDEKQNIPKEEGLDHSLKLLKEGYQFIMNRRHMFHSNIFETRLLAEKAICLTGKDAAEVFYDNDKFRRMDAAPKRLQKTLFGEDGVQGMDGQEHFHRKAMFMSIMTKDKLQEISDLTRKTWEAFALKSEQEDEVVLYIEAKKILTEVACTWTGVPLQKNESEKFADQLADMYESAAAIGLKHWKGRRARSSAENWLEDLVEDVRNGDLEVPKDRALYSFSMHKDLEGKLLDKEIVAVELLNLLRPIVAISVYICFAALALHQYPAEANKLKGGNSKTLQHFVQEVRRFYPFFPFTAARVKESFSWNGYEFEQDTLTLLDLYGTNHHPDDWENPDRFEPDRFQTWNKSPFDFIPQGGGEYEIGHRCAGEWLTVDVMKVSLDFLVNKVEYDLPEQDLNFSMTDIPSLPESKIKMSNIRLV
ncbi:cytochrome P450 [Bacillus sp. LL01]|uniref:cytochrome P450 n=1 Tax=Bacillus sp. LL01 TaxID=1665556 RepID=UPI00064D15AC|nr:cytochrome P450 [Bacillus sp. LL01]KMJ57511.1 cytochrome P450 [Bacillus sp. LL01]